MTRKVDGMTRLTVRRVTLLLAGAALLLTTGIAVGQAASKTPTYTACATKKNVLTLSNSKGKCARGTHVVKLSAKGPAGPPGVQGPKGDIGPAGPFPTTLPSRRTITGSFSISGATAPDFGNVSFTYPLAGPLDATHTPSVSDSGTSDPTHCAGSAQLPTAAPGFFCLYLSHTANVSYLTSYVLDLGQNGASTTGASVLLIPGGGGAFALATGSWALTAP
jgi:hypothetical protein